MRDFSSNSLKQDATLVRVLGSFPSLRAVLQNSHDYKTESFMQVKRWHHTQSGWSLDLKLYPFGLESFLGYPCAYGDLIRELKQESLVSSFLGDWDPIIIEKAVWLDLKGIEQALYMRLELAMQWYPTQVQLNSVYAEDFARLFAGIDGYKKTRRGKSYNFIRKLKLLKSLICKLYDHGVLAKTPKKDYLATAGLSSGLSLLWKRHEKSFYFLAKEKYERKVSDYYLSKILVNSKHYFWEILSLGLKEEKKKLLQELLEQSVSDLKESSKLLRLQVNNHIVSSSLLFIEYLYRAQKESSLPLSEPLKSSSIFSQFHKINKLSELQSNLKKFQIEIEQNNDFMKLIFANCILNCMDIEKSKDSEFSILRSTLQSTVNSIQQKYISSSEAFSSSSVKMDPEISQNLDKIKLKTSHSIQNKKNDSNKSLVTRDIKLFAIKELESIKTTRKKSILT